jgi:uncharacterized protein (DUF362 family)
MRHNQRTKKSDSIVYIKNCEEYDSDKMRSIIQEGMEKLKFAPQGKVYVKPNVVFAYKTKLFGKHAYTQPVFNGASLLALSSQAGVKRVDMGENCAVGIPTRLCYKHAGYYDEIKKVKRVADCPVNIFCIDEEPRDTVFIGGAVHDNLRITRKMARADSIVYLPKLKGHCVSNMTGAVKLNIGICSDDERSIRHDFLLNEKIVDLLAVGYPDFVIMDAIDVGMGNEAFPTSRKLGLILMGTNPLAVDLIGARLLGLNIDDVPYLKKAVERGYTPKSLHDVTIAGDLKSLKDVDKWAKRLLPYDDEYYRWRDVNKELAALHSPMRFMWGPYSESKGEKCLTGCVMGLKMFLSSLEKFNGPAAFSGAKPVVFVIGRYDKQIDAGGEEVFLLGSCAQADIVNAKKITHIRKCFTTAADMNLAIGHKLGLKAVTRDFSFLVELLGGVNKASLNKLFKGRYLQDIGHFINYSLLKKL